VRRLLLQHGGMLCCQLSLTRLNDPAVTQCKGSEVGWCVGYCCNMGVCCAASSASPDLITLQQHNADGQAG
jgi:hypothetical protein